MSDENEKNKEEEVKPKKAKTFGDPVVQLNDEE